MWRQGEGALGWTVHVADQHGTVVVHDRQALLSTVMLYDLSDSVVGTISLLTVNKL